MIVEEQDGASAMSRVAILIAVDEVRAEFPQVVRSDLPIAHHTHRSVPWRSPIHHDESHEASPKSKIERRIGGSLQGLLAPEF